MSKDHILIVYYSQDRTYSDITMDSISKEEAYIAWGEIYQQFKELQNDPDGLIDLGESGMTGEKQQIRIQDYQGCVVEKQDLERIMGRWDDHEKEILQRAELSPPENWRELI